MENPERMRSPLREPRRPNLATIVGSGLAVAAAGSLLAFSSLAEQAGLQGLAAGGLEPAVPGRGSATRAITIPAPAAPPGEPATAGDTLRDLVARVVSEPPAQRAAIAPGAPPDRRSPARGPEEKRPNRPERRAQPAFAARRVAAAASADDAAEYAGPPYGKAKGHHKHDKAEKAKAPRKQKPARSQEGSEAPVYAKTKASDSQKPKAPKTKVTKKSAASRGQGKAHGHDKHARARGKGKGHSKHGH